jgi:hypothetical protein
MAVVEELQHGAAEEEEEDEAYEDEEEEEEEDDEGSSNNPLSKYLPPQNPLSAKVVPDWTEKGTTASEFTVETMDTASPGGLLLCSPRACIGLFLIPFVDAAVGSFWYACLPMYLVQQGYGLKTLGLAATASNLARMLFPMAAVQCKIPLHKLKLPLQLCAFVAAASNWGGKAEPFIYINLFFLTLQNQRSVSQSIATLVLKEDPAKALRVYEATFTIGYCLSSLWGGGVFYVGGWVAVLKVQLCLLLLVIVLECIVLRDLMLPQCISNYERNTTSVSVAPAAAVVPTQSCHKSERHDEGRGQQNARRLCLFLGVGVFLVNFAYTLEWSLFLVYLSSKFGYSPLALGAGQMSGDAGGALVLVLTTSSGILIGNSNSDSNSESDSRTNSNSGNKDRRVWRRLLQLPFSLTAVLFLYATTFVAFISDHAWLAMAAQVVMGTFYVVLIQGFAEVVEWLSRQAGVGRDGGLEQQQLYQSFAATSDFFFVGGVATGNLVAYSLWADLGSKLFEATALLLVVYAAVYYAAFEVIRRGGLPSW